MAIPKPDGSLIERLKDYLVAEESGFRAFSIRTKAVGSPSSGSLCRVTKGNNADIAVLVIVGTDREQFEFKAEIQINLPQYCAVFYETNKKWAFYSVEGTNGIFRSSDGKDPSWLLAEFQRLQR